MSTLCLSDLGELRDEWLREPRPLVLPVLFPRTTDAPIAPLVPRHPADSPSALEAVAA